ncbi:hypothetical protein WEI85_31835 [Actinomycetes bacterium KLBMP 9797]
MKVTELAARAAKRAAIVALAAGALVGGTATAALADEDGSYHTGEFVVFQFGNFGGGVYDTSLNVMAHYQNSGERYINTPTTINDSPDSSKNGHTHRIYLYEHSSCEGSLVTHLGRTEPTTPTVGAWYSSLGFLNNKASAHSSSQSC